tara:strand:+ start:358 stop:603 length:246 start_codon:yes stop_codon:yes gene_type:complete
MEYNMADKEMKNVTPEPSATTENSQEKELIDMANRSSRSTIAVIDAVTQRGGFKGEELTTIGQLRDQCISIVQMYESLNQS